MPRPACHGAPSLAGLNEQGLKVVLVVGRIVTAKRTVADVAMGMAVGRDLRGGVGAERMGRRAMSQDHDNRRDQQRNGDRQRDRPTPRVPRPAVSGPVAHAPPVPVPHPCGLVISILEGSPVFMTNPIGTQSFPIP